MARATRWPAVAAVAACVAPVLWFLPMLWRGEVVFGHDINILWVPNHTFLGRTLAAGRWPLRNPHYHCGMPFLAGYQTNALYPPAWITAGLPATAAVTLLIAAHLAWAAVGGWWCARRLGAPHTGAVIAGWAVGWSGFAVAHTYGGHLPIVQAWAWVPWVLGAFWRLRRDQRPRAVAAAALCITGLLLAGSAQTAWMGLLALGTCGLGWSVRRRVDASWRAAVGAGIAALVLGGAWAAPQLAATLALNGESARATGMPPEWYAEHTLRPANLALWVSPEARGRPAQPFPDEAPDGTLVGHRADGQVFPDGGPAGLWWEQAGHIGLVPLFLAALGLAAGTRRRRWTFGLLAAGALAVALLLGPFIHWTGAVGVWAAAPFTAAGRFRAPVRFVAPATLALALLAAEGWRCWAASTGAATWRLAGRAAVATAALCVVCCALGAFGAGPALDWGRVALAVAPAAASLGLATAVLGRNRRPALAGAVLVAGTAAGLFPLFGSALLAFPRTLAATIFRGPAGVPPQLRDTPGRARVIRIEPNVTQNSGLCTGLEMLEGFDPLISAHYNRVLDRIEGRERPDRLVTYPELIASRLAEDAWTPAGQAWGGPVARWLDILGVAAVWTPDGIVRRDPLPRAWAVREVHGGVGVSRVPIDAILDAVEAPGFDPRTYARVECPPGSPAVPVPPMALEAVVTVRPAERPESVVCDVTADHAGVCVLSVPWSGGWSVRVDDGKEMPPYRVDGVIMGTPVPAGAHVVIFRYRAPGLALGWWIALLATLAAAAGAWRVRRCGEAA